MAIITTGPSTSTCFCTATWRFPLLASPFRTLAYWSATLWWYRCAKSFQPYSFSHSDTSCKSYLHAVSIASKRRVNPFHVSHHPFRRAELQNLACQVHYTYMYLQLYIHVHLIIHTCIYNERCVPRWETHLFVLSIFAFLGGWFPSSNSPVWPSCFAKTLNWKGLR